MLPRPLSKEKPRSRAKLAADPAHAAGTVLLTGFDAFGGETLNPSWLAVQALHGKQVLRHKIVVAQLPTVFDASLQMLRGLLDQHRPGLVICVGQAGGRPALSLERIAINVNDARIPDNAGAQPVDTAVIAGGPAAYFTTLPIKAVVRDLLGAGIAAEVSQTAGTFVCNHVFYGLMHLLATQRGLELTRGGFIHVPFLPEQGAPAMPLDEIVLGLKVAVRAALANTSDVLLGGGAIQ